MKKYLSECFKSLLIMITAVMLICGPTIPRVLAAEAAPSATMVNAKDVELNGCQKFLLNSGLVPESYRLGLVKAADTEFWKKFPLYKKYLTFYGPIADVWKDPTKRMSFMVEQPLRGLPVNAAAAVLAAAITASFMHFTTGSIIDLSSVGHAALSTGAFYAIQSFLSYNVTNILRFSALSDPSLNKNERLYISAFYSFVSYAIMMYVGLQINAALPGTEIGNLLGIVDKGPMSSRYFEVFTAFSALWPFLSQSVNQKILIPSIFINQPKLDLRKEIMSPYNSLEELVKGNPNKITELKNALEEVQVALKYNKELLGVAQKDATNAFNDPQGHSKTVSDIQKEISFLTEQEKDFTKALAGSTVKFWEKFQGQEARVKKLVNEAQALEAKIVKINTHLRNSVDSTNAMMDQIQDLNSNIAAWKSQLNRVQVSKQEMEQAINSDLTEFEKNKESFIPDTQKALLALKKSNLETVQKSGKDAESTASYLQYLITTSEDAVRILTARVAEMNKGIVSNSQMSEEDFKAVREVNARYRADKEAEVKRLVLEMDDKDMAIRGEQKILERVYVLRTGAPLKQPVPFLSKASDWARSLAITNGVGIAMSSFYLILSGNLVGDKKDPHGFFADHSGYVERAKSVLVLGKVYDKAHTNFLEAKEEAVTYLASGEGEKDPEGKKLAQNIVDMVDSFEKNEEMKHSTAAVKSDVMQKQMSQIPMRALDGPMSHTKPTPEDLTSHE